MRVAPPSVLDELLYAAFEDRHRRTVEALIQCQADKEEDGMGHAESGSPGTVGTDAGAEARVRADFERDVERVLTLQNHLDDKLRRQSRYPDSSSTLSTLAHPHSH